MAYVTTLLWAVTTLCVGLSIVANIESHIGNLPMACLVCGDTVHANVCVIRSIHCAAHSCVTCDVQSAASQSQHVVNILTSGDPVNAGDVEKVEADERNNNNTGLLAKGGPTAKVQVKCPRPVPAWILIYWV